MRSTRSQQGNVAHARRQDASRIEEFFEGVQNYLGGIDLRIEEPAVEFSEISSERMGETSWQIRERVNAERRRQQARFAIRPKVTCKARMGTGELKQC